ncbi:PREDICTED: nucleoside diphosphate-linked moiety X motif 8 isoform X1 [Bactrocera latifrons]|uniref:nucleoside diphosphate-linked moiety X motif 8 isoform X1 n=1 Tax=Bactrocera latifrons TaxID=174628 RepID=UPI0008DDF473|nr:PREDICTED: nucleoside diphosphate-linked moiety X motif 8 isoform X1 [Bactrocera latifrons]
MLVRHFSRCFMFRIIRRPFIIFATERTRIPNHNDNICVDKFLRSEILLSEENKQRAMQCMKKTPQIGLKMGQTTKERSFAAVLICLCKDEMGEISILYTRRSSRLSRHVRQISFPGGLKDSEDSDFIDCALREAEEEVGLTRNRLNIWGSGTLITPSHTAAIMPVVAAVNDFNLKELKLNADEVEEAFLISVRELVHPKTLKHTQFKGGWSTPNFVVGHNKVWGITGFLTNMFLRCLIPFELKRLKHHAKYVRPFKHHH